MIDSQRLQAAYATARADLLAECEADGCWTGRLGSSALATATALSALTLVRQQARAASAQQLTSNNPGPRAGDSVDGGASVEGGSCVDGDALLSAALGVSNEHLDHLVVNGLRWLVTQQNSDGGWGDTDRSQSNLAATMLVRAAFQFTGVPADAPDLLERADTFIARRGGAKGLRRCYEAQPCFAAPILTTCALSGLISWREVPSLPFEIACILPRLRRLLRMPLSRLALPALWAVGQVRIYHRPRWNPVTWLARRGAARRSLELITAMQPASGGFLETVPLTSFIVLSLSGMGRANHPVALRGARFLVASARPDGSWPVASDMANCVTALGIGALLNDPPANATPSNSLPGNISLASAQTVDEAAEEDESGDLASQGDHEIDSLPDMDDQLRAQWIERLCASQHRHVHPLSGAAPGGWSSTDRSGGVPDADNTAAALLALAAATGLTRQQPAQLPWRSNAANHSADIPATRWQEAQADAAGAAPLEPRTIAVAMRGIDWLLDLQNEDGGWPTFCRGTRKRPQDRSGIEQTANALRALDAWYRALDRLSAPCRERETRSARILTAIGRGFAFLEHQQQENGSWVPLWFGNEHFPREENPVIGTARVLLAYRDLDRLDAPAARRGFDWLLSAQDADGAWGLWCRLTTTSSRPISGSHAPSPSHSSHPSTPSHPTSPPPPHVVTEGPSVEETALALEALLCDPRLESDAGVQKKVKLALSWLLNAIEADRHLEPAPVGLHHPRLWYHEKLYPLIFSVSALAAAKTKLTAPRPTRPAPLHTVP